MLSLVAPYTAEEMWSRLGHQPTVALAPWPEVDVDIRPGLAFDAIGALAREEVDVVISSDPEKIDGIEFAALFDYSPVFVAAANHPLATRDFVEAEDFRGQTLIAYPVDRSRLDIFKLLLGPAQVEPAAIRRVELTAVILMLVAAGRGVSVLPDWVVRAVRKSSDYVACPITEQGLTRRMYAATRSEDTARPHIAYFKRLARQEAVKLQRGQA